MDGSQWWSQSPSHQQRGWVSTKRYTMCFYRPLWASVRRGQMMSYRLSVSGSSPLFSSFYLCHFLLALFSSPFHRLVGENSVLIISSSWHIITGYLCLKILKRCLWKGYEQLIVCVVWMQGWTKNKPKKNLLHIHNNWSSVDSPWSCFSIVQSHRDSVPFYSGLQSLGGF